MKEIDTSAKNKFKWEWFRERGEVKSWGESLALVMRRGLIRTAGLPGEMTRSTIWRNDTSPLKTIFLRLWQLWAPETHKNLGKRTSQLDLSDGHAYARAQCHNYHDYSSRPGQPSTRTAGAGDRGKDKTNILSSYIHQNVACFICLWKSKQHFKV